MSEGVPRRFPAADPAAPAGVAVRAARPDEYGELGELTVAAFVADGMPPASSYLPHLRDVSGRAGEAELLVAVDAGTGGVLGTVAFVVADSAYADLAGDDEAEFRMLAVRPDARGRGAGAALVRACLDRARHLGLRRVVISTRPGSHAARRLYERLGFRRDPDRDRVVGSGFELIAYRADL